MKSNLLIEKIEIVQTVIFINESVDFQEWNKENDLKFVVTPEIGVSRQDESSARLKLSVEVFDKEFLENQDPFYIHVVLYAYFTDTAEEDITNDKNVAQKFAVNMVSMAYPYVRSHVSSITALSGLHNVTLPAINVFKLFEEIQNKDKLQGKNK